MRRAIILFVTVLLSASIFAQAPQKISYQAIVRDTSNALLTNTNVSTRISILHGSASGVAIYVETHTPTTNSNGLISLEIGNGNIVSGTFSTINWANGPFFIKSETDPNGGTNYTISGTSQILSVPYSLHASRSDSSLYASHSDTAMYAKNSGDTNAVWSKNSNDIYFSNGNVGIGTINPGTQLEIIHDNLVPDKGIYLRGSITNSGSPRITSIWTGGNGSVIDAKGVKTGSGLHFYVNGTEKMVARDDGHIGIGTLTPKSQLEVSQGDVYISTLGKGLILKSPNSQCWRVTVDNSGNLSTSSITCP